MGLYLCRSRKGQREGLLDLKGPRQLVAWSKKWLLFILPLFLVRRSEGEGGERVCWFQKWRECGWERVGGHGSLGQQEFGETTGLLSYHRMTSGKFPYLHRALL